jgi:competence ComEA-like helix-hairpin-helix protein
MQQAVKSRNCARIIAVLGALFLLSVCFIFLARAQKKLPAEPVDLNSATIEQLEPLPGIGPSTAKEIVQFREKSGPFERVEDLLAIHRISKKRLEKLKPYVTVHPPEQKTHSKIGAQSCPESEFQFSRSQHSFCSELS